MQSNPIGIRIHDLGRNTPAALAAKMAGHGFTTGQLAIPKAVEGVESYGDIQDATLAEIHKEFGAKGIAIGVLGCYIEPVCPDEAKRKQSLAAFAGATRCAALLGAGCVATETPLPDADPGTPQAFDRLCHSVEQMLAAARPYGVKIALEPVLGHVLNSPAILARLLAKFKGENIGVIFDLLNLLPPERANRQEELTRECLDAFGSGIVALHIKDAALQNGAWRECTLGEGMLQYEALRKWLQAAPRPIHLLREGFLEQYAGAELAFLQRI